MSAQASTQGTSSAGASVWLVGILLAMANFLAVLDITIANVSVQNIAGSLGATGSQGAWVITSYAVAEAITVPLTGWLAGRFGAVRVFVASIIGFGVCSLLCGMAQSLEMLVLFRVMQGLAGGPLLPLSQTLLIHVFPPRQMPAAMALWVVTTLTAPIAGPILGGFLCDTFGWPAIFWVNVPIALVIAPIVFAMLRSKETPTQKSPVDVVGLSLLIVWVGALQLMLDLGKEHEWFASPMITGMAVTAAVGFVAFLIWELTERHPIVSLKVFRHRGFAVAALAMAVGYGGFMATNVLTPAWLQTNMGYTATLAGMAVSTMGILAIVLAPIVAKLTTKVDVRALAFVGLMWLAGMSLLRAGMTTQVTFEQVSLMVMLAGAGMPLFFLPLNTLAMGSIDPEETAAGAGLMNFIRTVSGAFSVAMLNTAWEDKAAHNQSELSGMLNGAQGTIDSLVATGQSQMQAVANLTGLVHGQSVMLATNTLMLTSGAMFLAGAAVIWLAPKPAKVALSMGH